MRPHNRLFQWMLATPPKIPRLFSLIPRRCQACGCQQINPYAFLSSLTTNRNSASRRIIELAKEGRTREALSYYLKESEAQKNNPLHPRPSEEARSQVMRLLYHKSNLAGLYALHLDDVQRTTQRSRRYTRAQRYLYAMLTRLVIDRKYEPTKVVALLETMEEYDVPVNVVIYNMVLELHIRRGIPSHVEAAFDALTSATLPNAYTYGLLLRFYGDRRDLDQVAKYLDHMNRNGVRPDKVIVSVLVFHVFCKSRQYDLAKLFVNEVYTYGKDERELITRKHRDFLLKRIEELQAERQKMTRSRSLWQARRQRRMLHSKWELRHSQEAEPPQPEIPYPKEHSDVLSSSFTRNDSAIT
ncbi:hypothetical protein BCR43DRAFT_481440 [Syncephalastrum racemosum]|uniref:Pentacotripeptide-repeat region of PRORP domain-containing protein n=1 Tax=Syncephalastrum racemosum TaxID=13706 RepID=A0A1X2HRY9_SYNRA|nr:hypothetical protein BCR43DRAFT_481440 [Syncephalastrum racemosum]